MYTYQVGNTYINNVYLALRESFKTGNSVRFYCNEHEFDRFDWSHEPEASLDFLMTDYAHVLRNKYDKLILAYSGGTDSHTVYNIFKDAKIHIDEIIIKSTESYVHMSPEVAKWLRKNHWDKTTVITEYDNYDKELKLAECSTDDWLWDNNAFIFSYGISPFGKGIMNYLEEKYGGHNFGFVSGQEKPRLIYRNGHWHHRQLNYSFETVMGNTKTVPFYMDPLIAIKQSHMCKHAVKKRISEYNLPLYDNDWAEAKWPRTHAGYRAWSDATGRHAELFDGASHEQKLANEDMNNVAFAEHGKSKEVDIANDARLRYDLLDNNPAAINHVHGFMNLITSEFGFLTWLKDNGHLKESEKQLKRINFIWSKEYDLGA